MEVQSLMQASEITFSALLPVHPIKGDALDAYRAGLSVQTLDRHGNLNVLEKLYVVVPDQLGPLLEPLKGLTATPDKIVLVNERDMFSEAERAAMTRMGGWHRQQLIKLAAPRIMPEQALLTLDADIASMRPFTREELAPGGRLAVHYGNQNPMWLEVTSKMVGLPAPERMMGVTPALLSREGLLATHKRVDPAGDDWVLKLCAASDAKISWTEYVLYQICVAADGLWDKLHSPDNLIFAKGLWYRTQLTDKQAVELRKGNPLFLVNQSVRPDSQTVQGWLAGHGFPSLHDLPTEFLQEVTGASRALRLRFVGPRQQTMDAAFEAATAAHENVAEWAASLPEEGSGAGGLMGDLEKRLAVQNWLEAVNFFILLLSSGDASPRALRWIYDGLLRGGAVMSVGLDLMSRVSEGRVDFETFASVIRQLKGRRERQMVERLLEAGRAQFPPSQEMHALSQPIPEEPKPVVVATAPPAAVVRAPKAPDVFERGHVTVVAIAKDEAAHIVEWVAWHLSVGFDSVHVYLNDCTDETKALLEKLRRGGLRIQAIDWPSRRLVSPQIAAYTHAVGKLRGVEWAAFIDIDEFIVPWAFPRHGIKEFLGTVPPEAGAVALSWQTFGSSGVIGPGYKSVMHTFRRRAPEEFQVNRHPKIIARLKDVVAPHIHDVVLNEEKILVNSAMEPAVFGEMGRLVAPVHAGIQINHYQAKTFPEFVARRAKGNANRNPGHWNNGRKGGPSDFGYVDRNDELDTRSDAFMARFNGLHDRLRAMVRED